MSADVPISASRMGNRKAVIHAPTLAKEAAKPAPFAPDGGREHFARDQVGLRVRTEIGHEIEQHESREDEQHFRAALVGHGLRRDEQSQGAADEAEDLQADAAGPVGEQDGEDDADQQQQVDQGGAFRGNHVVVDEIGQVPDILVLVADRSGEDGGRENADAVSPEILQEPRNRRENGGAQVFRMKQRGIAASAGTALMRAGRVGQTHLSGIGRVPREQPQDLILGFALASADGEPMRALGDEKPSEQNEDRGNDGARIHPPPCVQFGMVRQDQIADRRSDERAGRLETEGGQHQLAAASGGGAFGDHQMGRRVVASEREPHSEQADDQPDEVRGEDDQNEEQDEQAHLEHEHRLAAEAVGEAAQGARADQDAEQAGGADDAVLRFAELKVLGDQRQGDAGQEHDQSLEKLAGDRQPPDSPLHVGQRRARRRGPVGPQRRFVEIALNRIPARLPASRRPIALRHCLVFPHSFVRD